MDTLKNSRSEVVDILSMTPEVVLWSVDTLFRVAPKKGVRRRTHPFY